MRSRLTVASILDVFNFAKKCFKNTERIDRQIQLVSHQGEALGDLDRRLHRSCWKLGVAGKSADWNHTTWKLEDNKHGTVTYSASVCDGSSLHWVNVSRIPAALQQTSCERRVSEARHYGKIPECKVLGHGHMRRRVRHRATSNAWFESNSSPKVAEAPLGGTAHERFRPGWSNRTLENAGLAVAR